MYSYELKNAVEAAKDQDFNFENPGVFEIIEIFNIVQFFNDRKFLNEEGQKLLDSAIDKFQLFKSALNSYFKNIDCPKVKDDLRILDSKRKEDSYRVSDYFSALESNIDFSKADASLGDILLQLVPLDDLLKSKSFVETYSSLIKIVMLKRPESFCFLVSQFDDADSKREFHIPPFSEGDVDTLVNNYIGSEECNINSLFLAKLHRNSRNTYIISRKAKIKIQNTYQKLGEEMLIQSESQRRICEIKNIVSIDEHQKELHRVEFHSSEVRTIFSSSLFLTTDSFDIKSKKFWNASHLLDEYYFINSRYNPYKENGLTFLFEKRHSQQYGCSGYQTVESIYQDEFDFLYANLEKSGFSLENIAIWFVNYKINPLLHGSRIDLSFAEGKNFKLKCEHLFNQIESLLRQYRIYVEEGEITPELIEMTNDSIRIENVPSLIPDKYYSLSLNSDSLRIMHYLFSDQSWLNYINKNMKANNLFNLLKRYDVPYSEYSGRAKLRIDYLLENSILKINDKGILKFDTFETEFVWNFFYKNISIPSYFVDDKVLQLLNKYVEANLCVKYSHLFSRDEADYLDYILNDSKFSNAYALRNHYEHGHSSHFSENQDIRNYLIGLKTMLSIIGKIYRDLDEKSKI